jgi:hypothetical protein
MASWTGLGLRHPRAQLAGQSPPGQAPTRSDHARAPGAPALVVQHQARHRRRGLEVVVALTRPTPAAAAPTLPPSTAPGGGGARCRAEEGELPARRRGGRARTRRKDGDGDGGGGADAHRCDRHFRDRPARLLSLREDWVGLLCALLLWRGGGSGGGGLGWRVAMPRQRKIAGWRPRVRPGVFYSRRNGARAGERNLIYCG